jgi:RNA polymerase sigma-70 factor (ECF subfamily)
MADAAAAGIEELYEAHRHRVYGWAMRYAGGNRAFAEDLTQDVFIGLMRALETTQIADPAGWLYRSTANLAISRLRREGSLRTRLARLFSPPPPEAPATDQRAEAHQAMAVLATLPDQQRVALSMKILDGKSQREIAALLGLSEGYVSKLIDRAWAAVRAAGWEVPDGSA